jgi:hypothetical protein
MVAFSSLAVAQASDPDPTLLHQSRQPERKVAGNVITSESDPKVRIELPRSVQYVGADRWVLYGMADCELHAFVEADEQKNVQRLYWVQFEGYLPTRPELSHTYDSVRHTNIGGLDFYVDTWVMASAAADKPGSDTEHIKALIRGKGYILTGRSAGFHSVPRRNSVGAGRSAGIGMRNLELRQGAECWLHRSFNY